MKKTIIVLIIAAVLATGSYVAFAKEHMGGMMQMQGQGNKKMMMEKDMTEMCPMHMMMCKSMMSKQIVATEDGAIVVLAGNKLMKYDKELGLAKETELAIDMEKMQQKMEKMMDECPMRKEMMEMHKKMMGSQKEKSTD